MDRAGNAFYVPETDFEVILAQARTDASNPATERETFLSATQERASPRED